jgi:formylglycine-generating enzyme required for sulfatase activity
LVPLICPLRAFNRDCEAKKLNRTAQSLLQFLSAYLAEQHPRLDLPEGFVENQLQQGCLLMFDGMDEVAPEDRMRVREAIEGLVGDFLENDRNRYLATSRTAAYFEGAALAGFRTCSVLPLAPKERDDLIHRWYRAVLPSDEAEREARDLCRRIAVSDKRVQDLAVTPLMTTIFALVHYDRRELPKQRADLYEQAVRILLTEPHKEGEAGGSLRDWGGLDWETRRDQLSYIAFTLHQWHERGDAVLEDDLVEAVWQDFGAEERTARDAARDFLQKVADRGGLLEEENRFYGFYTHRTFREFLAGRYLAQELRPEQQLEFLSQHLNDDHWDEPVRLAAGYLAIGGRRRPNDFILLLARLDKDPGEHARAQVLAGLALSDLPAERIEENTRAEVIANLIGTLQNHAHISARLRVEAGRALALCGDSRMEVRTVDATQFCLVPAGPFFMGSEDSDKEAFDDEKPHDPSFNIPYDYAISQYPITNAQFQEFMDDDGYTNDRWWAVAKAHGSWKDGKVTRRVWFFEDEDKQKLEYKLEEADAPVDFGAPFNLSNHPVVGISWCEALAFTEWLTERWQRQGWLGTGQRVQLPNEPEWEKAARGGLRLLSKPVVARIGEPFAHLTLSQEDNPSPKRRYPWGDESDPNHANYEATGINTTSAVGCFLDPDTPYGCQDMAGNVWEWTRSLWGPWMLKEGQVEYILKFPYPYNTQDGREDLDAKPEVARVLRGGAFPYNAYYVRCACRGDFDPDYRYGSLGFRVVVSPFFSER